MGTCLLHHYKVKKMTMMKKKDLCVVPKLEEFIKKQSLVHMLSNSSEPTTTSCTCNLNTTTIPIQLLKLALLPSGRAVDNFAYYSLLRSDLATNSILFQPIFLLLVVATSIPSKIH